MVKDKGLVDFFLRGVNEPVALEIPLGALYEADEPKIRQALIDAGINIGYDAVEIINGREGRSEDSITIVTPVMDPKDLRALYDLVEATLEPIDVHLEYPYVRDIQHLPKIRPSSKVNREKLGDEMIETAMASGEYKTFKLDGTDSDYKDFARRMNGTMHLFAGATISDPYTVASDFMKRDTRMATSDVKYAIGYAAAMKSKSTHLQKSSDGFRYGFLYEYERAWAQPFFYNTGIERGDVAGYAGAYDETPVNRFTNPCVGRWFVWYDENNKNYYNVYKIPENDEHWESMLASLETVMHTGTKQISWINRLSQSDKQPKSVVKGVEPGQLQKYTDEYIAKAQKRQEDNQRLLAELNAERNEIVKKVRELSDKIAQYIKEVPGYQNITGNYTQRINDCHEHIKKAEIINARNVEVQSEMKSISEKMDALKQRANGAQEFDIQDVTKMVENVKKDALKYADAPRKIEDQIKVDESAMLYFLKNRFTELSDEEIGVLTPDYRRVVIESIFKEPKLASNMLSLAVKIYSMATKSERQDMFAYFDKYIGRDVKRRAESLKKVVEKMPSVPEEIKELSRGKSFFIDHLKRARKKMEFQKGKDKLEQKMNEMMATQTLAETRV